MEGSDSNGTQPCVVVVGGIRNKESIHLKVVVAKEVEGGVVATLEAVAEQLSFSESDGKVWVRSAHVDEQSFALVWCPHHPRRPREMVGYSSLGLVKLVL